MIKLTTKEMKTIEAGSIYTGFQYLIKGIIELIKIIIESLQKKHKNQK
ncbi:MAG: hypothetical protein K4H23_00465 [Mollicutes bacterium PWAP]|nr:hypothetical protein [Mollicutes bacterium PWAP]